MCERERARDEPVLLSARGARAYAIDDLTIHLRVCVSKSTRLMPNDTERHCERALSLKQRDRCGL